MDQTTSPEPIFSGMLEPLPIWAKPKDLWRWWENRRLIYNSIVGLTAMFSFFAFEFFAHAVNKAGAAGDAATEPMSAIALIVLVPILWNLGYCVGPIIDILFHQIRLKTSYGPLLFKVGVAFSVAVLCVPPGAYFILWVQQMAGSGVR